VSPDYQAGSDYNFWVGKATQGAFLKKLSERAPMNNPVATARITMNGHDRYSDRAGVWHQLVQPYMHFPRVPKKPIMVYSFALSPADLAQPSGTANFSRIDTAQLVLTFNATHLASDSVGTISNNANAFTRLLSVYAVNINVLRIISGMGGLAFSN
jgi:hypothetical protein